MIRSFAILLGLILGLAAAALAAGRISHLRQVGIVPLPAWTDGLDDRSGVLSGAWQAKLAEWPVSRIDWSYAKAGLEGVDYTLTVDTAGGALDGTLRIAPGRRAIQLALAEEELDLARLIAGARALDLRGLLAVDRASANLGLPDTRPVSVTGEGRIVGLALHGAELGDARLSVLPDGSAGWTGEVALDGPLEGKLTVTGVYDRPALRVDGTLTETAPLPSALRDWMARFASEAGGAWTISAGTDAKLLFARP